jgi:hypothetical protein
LSVVKWLAEEKSFLMHENYYDKYNILFHALKYDRHDIVFYLLEKYPEHCNRWLKTKMHAGLNFFHYACYGEITRGFELCLEYLCRHKSILSFELNDEFNNAELQPSAAIKVAFFTFGAQ